MSSIGGKGSEDPFKHIPTTTSSQSAGRSGSPPKGEGAPPSHVANTVALEILPGNRLRSRPTESVRLGHERRAELEARAARGEPAHDLSVSIAPPSGFGRMISRLFRTITSGGSASTGDRARGASSASLAGRAHALSDDKHGIQ